MDATLCTSVRCKCLCHTHMFMLNIQLELVQKLIAMLQIVAINQYLKSHCQWWEREKKVNLKVVLNSAQGEGEYGVTRYSNINYANGMNRLWSSTQYVLELFCTGLKKNKLIHESSYCSFLSIILICSPLISRCSRSAVLKQKRVFCVRNISSYAHTYPLVYIDTKSERS